ncbi:hypothetical protein [Pseudomonas duriflava]|uniref:hypothetical protein n=1 Tax=Pseudomonas duriflava TaxID=459528 RepID=UPI00119E6522|nr:hypothetical protein [Pseudomonas duriflava]
MRRLFLALACVLPLGGCVMYDQGPYYSSSYERRVHVVPSGPPPVILYRSSPRWRSNIYYGPPPPPRYQRYQRERKQDRGHRYESWPHRQHRPDYRRPRSPGYHYQQGSPRWQHDR